MTVTLPTRKKILLFQLVDVLTSPKSQVEEMSLRC